MFLDSTEGCNEEDQIGRAVPAQRLPVGVKRRWMRQSVRGVEARKVSDNEQMSWYFAQEESVEFNLQHTRYVREDLSTTRRRVFKLGVETSRWWESWSILAKQLSSSSSQGSDEMLSNSWRGEGDGKGVQIQRTERLKGSCRHSWGWFCSIFLITSYIHTFTTSSESNKNTPRRLAKQGEVQWQLKPITYIYALDHEDYTFVLFAG